MKAGRNSRYVSAVLLAVARAVAKPEQSDASVPRNHPHAERVEDRENIQTYYNLKATNVLKAPNVICNDKQH